jgi:phosphoserine phosphatase
LATTNLEIPKWTAEEFEHRVLECKPRVAVVDCDGTLWGGDAGYGFMVWSLERGLVSRTTSDWIDTRYRGYTSGKVTEAEMCGEMVQMYAGLHERELREAAAKYVKEFVAPRVFPEMFSLVSALQQRSVEIWAVSSTNRWVIAEGVRGFNIPEDHILAADVRVVDDVITSEILHIPTDEGKATALRQVGLPAPDAVFGNSIHDLAMLDIARCAFPVNPSPALLDAARLRGWGYFSPSAATGSDSTVGGE